MKRPARLLSLGLLAAFAMVFLAPIALDWIFFSGRPWPRMHLEGLRAAAVVAFAVAQLAIFAGLAAAYPGARCHGAVARAARPRRGGRDILFRRRGGSDGNSTVRDFDAFRIFRSGNSIKITHGEIEGLRRADGSGTGIPAAAAGGGMRAGKTVGKCGKCVFGPLPP